MAEKNISQLRNELVERYIPMVDFIAEILGENCEVVLHNITNPEHSIIAIRNNHISGRKVGGPLTDLSLQILKGKHYAKQDFICNYKANAKNRKILRSSSYFIKDETNEIIGMLCVNIDITAMIETRNFLNKMIQTQGEKAKGIINEADTDVHASDPFENLEESIDDVLTSIVKKVLSNSPVSPDRMSPDEKIDVVRELNEKGVFLLKGGVAEVAKHLETSETTIYRYLNKIK